MVAASIAIVSADHERIEALRLELERVAPKIEPTAIPWVSDNSLEPTHVLMVTLHLGLVHDGAVVLPGLAMLYMPFGPLWAMSILSLDPRTGDTINIKPAGEPVELDGRWLTKWALNGAAGLLSSVPGSLARLAGIEDPRLLTSPARDAAVQAMLLSRELLSLEP